MGVEKKVYSIRLEEKMMEKLKHNAELQNRTLSNLVETILKAELKRLNEQKEP